MPIENPRSMNTGVTRRTFLQGYSSTAALVSGVFAGSAQAGASNGPPQPAASPGGTPASKAPRFYYHNDGTFLMYVQPAITLERFVHETVGHLLGTQVGGIICHMFSAGDAVPLFRSAIEDAQVVEPKTMTSVNTWKYIRNRAALVRMTPDPWQKAIQKAHEDGIEFWGAMRFNDAHPDTYGLRNRLGTAHPEYYLGSRCALHKTPIPHVVEEVCRHLDYSIPQVRAHRLRQLEEVCTLYDVDGIELDFTRDIGHNFPSAMKDEGVRLLTQYLQDVRDALRRVGQRRGRPIKLGARVPGTPQACRDTGHDVERWVREGLLDVLTPSVYYDTSCELPFDAFVKIAQGSSCHVYASVMEGVGPGRFAPPPLEAVRAGGLNAWRHGVYGINLFNFHHQLVTNRTNDVTLLSELGSPHTLEHRNKFYMIAGDWGQYRGQRASTSFYVRTPDPLGAHPHQLPLDVPVQPNGPGVTVRVPIADDIAKARADRLLASLVLRLDLCNVTGEEEMELQWNSVKLPLAMAKLEPSLQYPWNWNGVHGQLEATFDLTHGEWVRQGDNEFRLQLRKRPDDLDLPLRLWALRLEVNYNVFPTYLGRDAAV